MANTNTGEKVKRGRPADPPQMSATKPSACSCGQPSNPAGAHCTRCASKLCTACHGGTDSHGYCPTCQRAPANFKEGPGKQEEDPSFPGSEYLPQRPNRNY